MKLSSILRAFQVKPVVVGALSLMSTAAVVMVATTAEPESLAHLDQALQAVISFQYGKDSRPLEYVEKQAVEAARDRELRAAVEQRILRALSAASTREAKAFLCRQLRVVGTAQAIPQLEELLTNPELSHMARYILGRMNYAAASDALYRAAVRTTGQLQAGIISTLGQRKYQEGLPLFVKLLDSPDALVAEAAAGALGALANTDAAQALESARQKASGPLRQRLDDALLICADRFLEEGQKTKAARIYEMYYAPNQPPQLRLAALRGLVAVRGAKSTSTLIEAISSPDPLLHACAINFVRTLPDPAATTTFAHLLSSLPADAQELLLRALGACGDSAAVNAVMDTLKSEHPNVRVAALEALGNLGNAACVPRLLHTAATTNGQEQQMARESLARLKGDLINSALVQALAAGDAPARVEAVRALAARRVKTVVKELLKLAMESEPAVRREAIGALGTLAVEADLTAILTLVVKPETAADRPLLEQAVGAALGRMAERSQAAGLVLAALNDAPTEARPTLLKLLGRAPTARALPSLRAGLADPDAAVQDAALRTLAEWPDATPSEDLLTLAAASTNATQKVIALRGYIRMAGLSLDAEGGYARAMAIAERVEDKKLVLGSLGTASSPAALNLVEPYLKNESLRAEAAAAVIQIADKLRVNDAARAKAALKNVLANTTDPRLRQSAQEVINQMQEFESYILDWVGTGPCQVKDKDAHALFDLPLPPEQPDAQDVKWQKLTKGIGTWDVNLGEALGNADDCVAYVRTRVWSPSALEARLELSSDDGIKVWLNGSVAHANNCERGLAPRQDTANVKLKEGWNVLLLKITNRGGGWGFACRLRQPDGSALEGLKIEAN